MKKKDVRQQEIFNKVAPLIKKAYEVMTSNPEECIQLAQTAVKISEKHSFSKGIAHGHMHIGLGKYHQGEFATAMECYKKAEEIFLKDNDYHGLRSVYNNIGVIYNRWKDRDKGLEYFQKNLALSDKIPNNKLDCTVLVNLGNIHYWSNDYEASKQCYHKALKLAREVDFKYGEALALTSIGEQLMKEGKLEEAAGYYDQAYQLRVQTNDVSGIILLHFNHAAIQFNNQDYAKAIEHCEQAMQLALEINDKHSISYSALRLAESYHELKVTEKEKEYLEQCLSLASEHKYRDMEVHALRELASWYESNRDFEAAIKTYWRYQDAKNYLIDQERNHNIQQLRVQLQVQEKEREVELIRCMNQALEKKNRQISRQKDKLEKAEKALLQWNHTLEQRVAEETEKRRKQEQMLIQKSKLESLGRMAAGIAHEINQPLGMISLGIENLLNKIESSQTTKAYLSEKSAYFAKNIERINQIIEHVRLFSRDQQDSKTQLIDLRTTINDSLSMIKTQCKNQNVSLNICVPEEPVYVLGNKYRLEQVLLNLFSNARDALEEKFDAYDDRKQIGIHLDAYAGKAVLAVQDNGSGIPADKQERIFEPFYTTKSESNGTGLGLSICYGIIHELEGSLSVQSTVGEGTCMSLDIPLAISRKL